ncbi:glycosyltransferase family 39 protein [PVC group bacterium]|nr:glycosyltransferase family 39 protein [PVC group bacterium]
MHISKRTTSHIITLLIVFGVVAVVCLTMENFSGTKDEIVYLKSSKNFIEWLQWGIHSKSFFAKEVIHRFWDAGHEHPSVLKIVSGITWFLFQDSLGDLASLRLGTVLFLAGLTLFSFTVLKSVYGVTTAFLSIIFFIGMPRIFGYFHLAEITIQLTCLWNILLLWIYLIVTKKIGRAHYFLCGIIWGLICAAKITGILLVIIAGLFILMVQKKDFFVFLGLWCMGGALSFFLSWPSLWYEGWGFFARHVNYFYNENLTIQTFYLGRMYTELPWHYPWTLFLVTTPVYLLLLLALGGFFVFQRRDLLGVLALLNIFVVLGALSLYTGYPGDGIRHFLVIYPLLGYVMAFGLKCIPSRSLFHAKGAVQKIAIGLVCTLLFFENAIVFPDNFQYYNQLVDVKKGYFSEQYYP